MSRTFLSCYLSKIHLWGWACTYVYSLYFKALILWGKQLDTNTISSFLFIFVFKARWWCHMPFIQELRRQRQANLWFKASLAYKTEFLDGEGYSVKPYLKKGKKKDKWTKWNKFIMNQYNTRNSCVRTWYAMLGLILSMERTNNIFISRILELTITHLAYAAKGAWSYKQ